MAGRPIHLWIDEDMWHSMKRKPTRLRKRNTNKHMKSFSAGSMYSEDSLELTRHCGACDWQKEHSTAR